MASEHFDVIIVGGATAGLSAALVLARSRRRVLVIDNGQPSNRFAQHSHNFLMHDGETPLEIGQKARAQVEAYETVKMVNDTALEAFSGDFGFRINTRADFSYTADKIILACGLDYELSRIEGYRDCWGISALHCPYCHGYEFIDQPTAILFEDQFSSHYLGMIHHLSSDLVVLTNGTDVLNAARRELLASKNIKINEAPISALQHDQGVLQKIEFASGESIACRALYSIRPAVYHNDLALGLGCELDASGYIKRNGKHETNQVGVYACGDVSGAARSIAVAVASGNLAGISVHEALVEDRFV